MQKVKVKKPQETKDEGKESKKNVSLIGSLVNDLMIAPSFFTSLTYINIFIAYVVILLLLTDHEINYWYGVAYIPLLFLLSVLRKSHKEKERLEIAHSIPFFADALANALLVGETLEQAFTQAAFYLKGNIKAEFISITLKSTLGKNLDILLRELDAKFPNTGLIYLISLLASYSELGVGISPLLKRISVVLKQREKAEEKIRTILSAGSTYAWLTIGIFIVIFAALGFMLKDQMKYLLSPELKPIFIFLLVWAFIGIIIVTHLTSLEYTRTSSMKSHIMKFFSGRKLSHEEALKYSGVEWSGWKQQFLMFFPIIMGVGSAYFISSFYEDIFVILLGFFIGYFVFNELMKYIINGLVEDQLIKTIELFPEILQIFIIGLNSGLNNYLSFQFALNAIKEKVPKILNDELIRTKFAMECGEEYGRTWYRLAHRLPFESVTDFAEIMAVAPMQGESVVNAIIEMTENYQEKKLLLIEKKATKTSQLVIPIIIVAFFPLFIFFVFAPMINKITIFLTH